MTGGSERVVVVGAGHGGATAAAVLRQQGFAGEIVLLSDEDRHPYDRPPLSKSLFTRRDEALILPEDFFTERGIDLRLGVSATAIDRGSKVVLVDGGVPVEYDWLVLATGARARTMQVPGFDLAGVHALRTAADAARIEAQVTGAARLAIIGGGWIGLEIAAAAVGAGHSVTVIEREDRVLARVGSPQLSDHVTRVHAGNGVRILTGSSVSALEGGPDGGVVAVLLADGDRIPCDQAVVAVGAVPNEELAKAAGLRCEDGVVVDEDGRTDDPAVFAIGDVTRRPVHDHDGLVRLESIPSALEQGRRAVGRILGREGPPVDVPWFWSNQFDMRLQIAGRLGTAVGSHRLDGPDDGSVAFRHVDAGGAVVCVEAVNWPTAFRDAKKAIRSGEVLAPEPADDRTASPGREADGPAGDLGTLPEITFILGGGGRQCVEAALGKSLMEIATKAGVPGVEAECGGGCACGTCHVLVDAEMVHRLPPPGEEEADMLEFVEGVEATSRLSCQITVTAELDGLVLHVPDDDS